MISWCCCGISGAPAPFQAGPQHSRPTCSIPGPPVAFQGHQQHSRPTCSIPKEDVFPWLLYCDWRCSQTCYHLSQTCSRNTPVLPKFSLAHRGVPTRMTITPMVFLYHSSEISVTLKAGRNALVQSDTLRNSTHLSVHSTSSQTLLKASRD
jgi:hypothetical protein